MLDAVLPHAKDDGIIADVQECLSGQDASQPAIGYLRRMPEDASDLKPPSVTQGILCGIRVQISDTE